MSHNNITTEINKSICHGFNCFNIAIHCIKEDGYDGWLLLCDDCLTKFPKQKPATHESSIEAPRL